jgi:hypothetical protein
VVMAVALRGEKQMGGLRTGIRPVHIYPTSKMVRLFVQKKEGRGRRRKKKRPARKKKTPPAKTKNTSELNKNISTLSSFPNKPTNQHQQTPTKQTKTK